VEYRSSRGNSNYRVLLGDWTCNNALFGDPDEGYVKKCYAVGMKVPLFNANFSSRVANEGGALNTL